MSSRDGVSDERSRRVAESLLIGNPANNARGLAASPDLLRECRIELDLGEIRAYEGNPRRSLNPRFDDIKESIRTAGLLSPLTVTQRPGEAHFIVESGGNTRLLALRQLWAETKDPRYRRLQVLFRPWSSESHVLTAHLIENEKRGEMSFWDRATGIVALKERLEAEQGRTLSLRPFEDELHGLGLTVNTATLALYLFATQRLRIIGESVPGLSGLDVKTLQPRLNALRRYATSRGNSDEDTLYRDVFEPVFTVASRSFSVASTVAGCEEALARHLGESAEALRANLRSGRGILPMGSDPGAAIEAGLTVGRSFEADLLELARRTRLDGLILSGLDASQAWRCSLPEAISLDPTRQKAWSAISVLAEDAHEDESSSGISGRELVDWLTEIDEASVEAFWRVLGGLRRQRASRGAPSLQEGRDADLA